MNQTEYCKHSGLSKGRVSQLVANGMPLTSPEEADDWRGSRKGIGGRPSDAQRLAAIQQHQSAPEVSGGPYRPPEAAIAINAALATEDSPQGAYERQ